MEFIEKENGNLEYENENGIFTLVNMGSYVGHRSREWYQNAPECWRLMFYKSKSSDLRIEALVDASGEYSRIMVMKGNNRRVLMLSYRHVDEDIILEMESEDDFFPNKEYIAFNDPYREKARPELNEYLNQQAEFKDEEGKVYEGVISSNSYIIQFLNANTSLLKQLSEQKEESRSK